MSVKFCHCNELLPSHGPFPDPGVYECECGARWAWGDDGCFEVEIDDNGIVSPKMAKVLEFPFRAKPPKTIKLVLEGTEYEFYVKDYEITHGPGFQHGISEVSLSLVTQDIDKETRQKLAMDLCESTLPRDDWCEP